MVAERSGGAAARRVFSLIRRRGLLLKQDKSLPSVVGLVTGEALSGSWWNHPRAKEIFDLLELISERSNILETKLIDGKVTFIFETLWPAWLGVATCKESWQTATLSTAAKKLFSKLNRLGECEESGEAVKELERRLLVRSEQRHTQSGKHVLMLESWESWAKRRSVRALPVVASKAVLEQAALSLGAPLQSLPWYGRERGRKKARSLR